jgi:hypothetical protein
MYYQDVRNHEHKKKNIKIDTWGFGTVYNFKQMLGGSPKFMTNFV